MTIPHFDVTFNFCWNNLSARPRNLKSLACAEKNNGKGRKPRDRHDQPEHISKKAPKAWRGTISRRRSSSLAKWKSESPVGGQTFSTSARLLFESRKNKIMQIRVIELSNWRTTKRSGFMVGSSTMEARTWIAEIRRHSNVRASARGSVLNINTKVHKHLCFRVWCWTASLVECALIAFLFS